MIEGKRQKQVAAVLEKELNDIFQRLGPNDDRWWHGVDLP